MRTVQPLSTPTPTPPPQNQSLMLAPAPVPPMPMPMPAMHVEQPILAIDPALLMMPHTAPPAQTDKPPPLPLTLSLPPPPSFPPPPSPSKPRKRKSDEASTSQPQKKPKSTPSSSQPHTQPQPKVLLKLGPRPDDTFPCCLCASSSPTDLLPVYTRPAGSHAAWAGTRVTEGGGVGRWMAHESCAMVVPETYVDFANDSKMVFGVDAILKDRWNLVRLTSYSVSVRRV